MPKRFIEKTRSFIVGAVLVLFGATAVPKFARSIGKARAEFEKGLKEGQEGKNEKEDKNRKEEEKGKEES